MDEWIRKKNRLDELLAGYDSLAVAVSGGVDSMFLLAAAMAVFRKKSTCDRLLALSAASRLHPAQDINAAKRFATENNICHQTIHTQEMSSSAFLENTPNRCYVCKKIMFARISEVAEKAGISAVAHGVNKDDEKEFRPGLKAAAEMNVLAPLALAGLTKHDIRLLSREMGLSVWDKPASGCLATRIPYGQSITPEKLDRIGAAEQVLVDLGIPQCRVRHDEDMARIEVPELEMKALMRRPVRQHVIERFRKIGFRYVLLDMEGFASGRLNRSLED